MLNTGSRPRAAIITGGASGIGLATAERLLASGWRVGSVRSRSGGDRETA